MGDVSSVNVSIRVEVRSTRQYVNHRPTTRATAVEARMTFSECCELIKFQTVHQVVRLLQGKQYA